MAKKKGKKGKELDAHNPHYCMITPDPKRKDEEDISSAGQS